MRYTIASLDYLQNPPERKSSVAKKARPFGSVIPSQGWTALILDTNANGKRDEYVDNPNAPVHGFSPRGLDIDRNRVQNSDHLIALDNQPYLRNGD